MRPIKIVWVKSLTEKATQRELELQDSENRAHAARVAHLRRKQCRAPLSRELAAGNAVAYQTEPETLPKPGTILDRGKIDSFNVDDAELERGSGRPVQPTAYDTCSIAATHGELGHGIESVESSVSESDITKEGSNPTATISSELTPTPPYARNKSVSNYNTFPLYEPPTGGNRPTIGLETNSACLDLEAEGCVEPGEVRQTDQDLNSELQLVPSGYSSQALLDIGHDDDVPASLSAPIDGVTAGCQIARRHRRRHPHPQSLLGAGRTNPFPSIWPVTEPNVDMLVDKYIDLDYMMFGQDESASFHPIRDLVVRIVMENATAMLAVAAYGATSADPVRKPGAQALQLKVKTLRTFKERLQTVKVDDALIYGFYMMWALEARYGSPTAAQHHKRGVELAVQHRGGYLALGSMLQWSLVWAVIALPDPLNLSPLPWPAYLGSAFTELTHFAYLVHALSLSHSSPYPIRAHVFVLRESIYRLLIGKTAGRDTMFKATPHVRDLCRLAALLTFHSIFLDNCHDRLALKVELERLESGLSKQDFDRNGTVEILVVYLFKGGDSNVMRNPGRVLSVLRMITVAKRLSRKTVGKALELFSGYLMGRRYTEDERRVLWDVEPIERELFGDEPAQHRPFPRPR